MIPLNLPSGESNRPNQMRLTALGALAVSEALSAALPPALPAQIKWPNDVIAARRKLAGVLVELEWMGDQLEAAILGIGVNVAPRSVPAPELLDFPATCVEALASREVDRWYLLRAILESLLCWEQRIQTDEFVSAWRDRLAFCGEWVRVITDSGEVPAAVECQIAGLDSDGSLRVRQRSGEITTLQFGEVRLRPIDSPQN
jgi:BirA family biotin operon repressor/biotin-[acetyl-CoA-carboxylase] ligase